MQTSDNAGIVKLWGEDALLDWPGAFDAIITDRDAFMVRTLRAAAVGLPAAPAYVLDTSSGRRVFR